jgi:hypothetical protein
LSINPATENDKFDSNSRAGWRAVSMIHLKSYFALGACLFGCLVTPTARADGPQQRPAPRRLEPARPLPHTSTTRFGLRLPKILSLGAWSAPAPSARVPSHAPRPTECRSHCAEGPITDRGRATTSAILAGVGGLAVVTGVVLTFSTPRQSERLDLAPKFRVKLSGQRAVASADWSF